MNLQAIPLDPKTYMTIARSRMASMDGTCDGNPPSKLYLVPLRPQFNQPQDEQPYNIESSGSLLHLSATSSGGSPTSTTWTSQTTSMRAPLIPKPRGPLPATPREETRQIETANPYCTLLPQGDYYSGQNVSDGLS